MGNDETGRRKEKRIVFDSDTTMGLPDCDIDDGMALLFAMGYGQERGCSCIEALCTSYGNSTLEAVHANTLELRDAFGLDVPVFKGASDKEHPHSEAAEFIVSAARENPGELSLAVTGSTTNLKGALELDPDVLSRYREVVLMGGITQTLVFNGRIMNELNLSCDAEATLRVLEAASRGANVAVATSNNCLPAAFARDEFLERLSTNTPGGGCVRRLGASWFDTMERWYGLDGFCCWDVLVPAFILTPELFVNEPFDVVLDPRLLEAGFFEPAFPGAPCARIVTPRIANPHVFTENAYRLWGKAVAAVDDCSRENYSGL